MRSFIFFIAVSILIQSCRSYTHSYRQMDVEPYSEITIGNDLYTQIEVNWNRKVAAKSQQYKIEKLAFEEAYYKAITENDIHIVADPLYRLETRKYLMPWRQPKYIVEITGYAGYYKNQKTGAELTKDSLVLKKEISEIQNNQEQIIFNKRIKNLQDLDKLNIQESAQESLYMIETLDTSCCSSSTFGNVHLIHTIDNKSSLTDEYQKLMFGAPSQQNTNGFISETNTLAIAPELNSSGNPNIEDSGSLVSKNQEKFTIKKSLQKGPKSKSNKANKVIAGGDRNFQTLYSGTNYRPAIRRKLTKNADPFGVSRTQSNVLGILRYDKRVAEKFNLGFDWNRQTIDFNWQETFNTDLWGPQISTFYYRETSMKLLFRTNYEFSTKKRLRLSWSNSLGFKFITNRDLQHYSSFTTNPNLEEYQNIVDRRVPFAYRSAIEARYFITKKLGLYLDFEVPTFNSIYGGATFNF